MRKYYRRFLTMKDTRICLITLASLCTVAYILPMISIASDDGNLIEGANFEKASISAGREYTKLSIQKKDPVSSGNTFQNGQYLKIEISENNKRAGISLGVPRIWVDSNKRYRLSFKVFTKDAIFLKLSSYAYNAEKKHQPLKSETKGHWILSLRCKGPTKNWETKEITLGPTNSGSEIEFPSEMEWMNLNFTTIGSGIIYLADLELREINVAGKPVNKDKRKLHKSTAMIPELNWEKRSDWIDVKADVTPAAKGDGVADDTEAIQAALDIAYKKIYGTSIYFPPGTYRITKTLVMGKGGMGKKTHRLSGTLFVGHGRGTKLIWDGEENGVMFWSRGSTNTRYVGFVWDGRGRAAMGIDHKASHFETELRHQHEAFLNFTEAGIRIGKGPLHSAEIIYENCLFERCKVGVALLSFNDYDNTFDGCEFRECNEGIVQNKANAYIRNCHFESSTVCDIRMSGEHCSSVRRCTSVGSECFLKRHGNVTGLTIQDCRVDKWKSSGGAVCLRGGPVILMDNVFTNPPYGSPPVRYARANQRIFLSNNKAEGSVNNTLLQNLNPQVGMIYEVPAGKLGGSLKSAQQSFLKSQVRIPGKVFDVKRDFGAKGDNKTDDTAAIRKAIESARAHGNGAIAYFPTGRYVVTEILEISGSDYYVGGSGFSSALVWKGKPGGTTIQIIDPQNLTLENICVGFHNYGRNLENEADIVQTGSDKPSFMIYDEVYVYGMYQKKPYKQGLRFMNMSKQDTVLMKHVNGNLRFIDAARGTFLINASYEGIVTLEGKSKKRDGFLGFLTRLTTNSDPALIVKDNHSIVMSDFYVEQADSYIWLKGGVDSQAGRVTIQGAKVGLKKGKQDNVLIDIDNYQGEFTFGHNQFYPSVPLARIYSKGDAPLNIVFAANFFYGSKPDIKLGPETKLTYIGNQGIYKYIGEGKNKPLKEVENTKGANPMPQLVRAFDDLRVLGELDLRLNHPHILK